MDNSQYRKARKLVHECCNYDDGNCIALDDGETCVCVQSISYSLLCKWFRAAVLPLDAALYAEVMERGSAKRCAGCGSFFLPPKHNSLYCPACVEKRRRESKRTWARKNGDMCRKSSVQKPCKYRSFERWPVGWQGVYTFPPENGLYFFYKNAKKSRARRPRMATAPGVKMDLLIILYYN